MTQYHRQRGRYPPEQRRASPIIDYLQGGYFDDKGNIKCELITTTAEGKAQQLGYSGITSTQLRRFFMQVRAIERELGRKSFPELIPQIQTLQPLAANYVGRGRNRQEREGRQNLKTFIDVNVALAVRDKNSFKKGFVPHFESVVAYYKYHFPRK